MEPSVPLTEETDLSQKSSTPTWCFGDVIPLKEPNNRVARGKAMLGWSPDKR